MKLINVTRHSYASIHHHPPQKSATMAVDSASSNIFLFSYISFMNQVERTEWVLNWPGQVVIAGCQTFWTTMVEEALENKVLPDLSEKLYQQVSYTLALQTNWETLIMICRSCIAHITLWYNVSMHFQRTLGYLGLAPSPVAPSAFKE